jgi:PAS domain S-box-containing protein
VGRSTNILFPADRLKEAEEILVRSSQGESIAAFETVFLRKDGRPLEVSVTISPLKNEVGKIIGSSKILRDITEFNRVKRQIEEQTALLDKTQDAIVVFDLEGRILFWNKGAERVYGWARPEAVGRSVGEFLYVDVQKFREINSLTVENSEWSGELQHLAKDRQELVIESRWSLLRDRDGQPKSILAINTDVSELRRIEVQFMRAQRMESLGILAGGIAHDLNNILTPIMLSIDMLKHMAVDLHTKSIIETIEISARRGSDIVQQVLSFARGMEGQRIVIQPKYLLKDIEHIFPQRYPAAVDAAARHVDDFGRSHAGATDPAEPVRERARCDAQRRHAFHQRGKLPGRCAVCRDEPAGEGGIVRRDFRNRCGRRHCAGNHVEDFRALLHHEGSRQGHGPRTLLGEGDHQEP